MKFITSRIHLGAPRPSAIAERIKTAGAQQGTVKTASAAAPVVSKKAAFPAGHEHKFKANAEKLKGKKKEIEVEADADCATMAKGEVEIKVAEGKEEGVEKYEAGKKEATEFTNDAEKKPEDAKKPEKEAGKAATTTTKTQDGTFPSSGQPQWEGKPENNNKPVMPTDKNTKASAEDLLKRIIARINGHVEKIANLKPELKKDTKEYWRDLFGEDYADAMVADK